MSTYDYIEEVRYGEALSVATYDEREEIEDLVRWAEIHNNMIDAANFKGDIDSANLQQIYLEEVLCDLKQLVERIISRHLKSQFIARFDA